MKLRVRGNSVRLRLTQGEVAQFGETGLVENHSNFGADNLFTYAVSISEAADSVSANFSGGRIQVLVPKEIAVNWISTDEVGIEASDGDLTIMIEKDFACLTVREGEDESDAFPHPKQDEVSC